MNKTQIDWCDYTWNPFVGCSNGCWYCYARKAARRVGSVIGCWACREFQFHTHLERIDQPKHVSASGIVFLGSMCDLFCDDAMGWKSLRDGILMDVILQCSQHQFIVLTKRAENVPDGWNGDVPNLWVGVSVTGDAEGKQQQNIILRKDLPRTILCLEPLLEVPDMADVGWFDWLIIGGLTKAKYPRALEESGLNLGKIVRRAEDVGVPVFLKRNLAPRIPLSYIGQHQDYPEQLKRGQKQAFLQKWA